jgi:hypothetical protein
MCFSMFSMIRLCWTWRCITILTSQQLDHVTRTQQVESASRRPQSDYVNRTQNIENVSRTPQSDYVTRTQSMESASRTQQSDNIINSTHYIFVITGNLITNIILHLSCIQFVIMHNSSMTIRYLWTYIFTVRLCE